MGPLHRHGVCRGYGEKWPPIVGQNYKCILLDSPTGFPEPVVPPISVRRPSIFQTPGNIQGRINGFFELLWANAGASRVDSPT